MSTFDFTSAFEDAADAGFGDGDDLTPGRYDGKFVSANVGKSKAGDVKLGFMFKADEDSTNDDGHDVSGDVIWMNLTFSAKGAQYAARDAQKLGLTAAMLNADAEAAVQTVVGQRWSATVKLSKDGEWTNLYLNKRLDDAPAASAPAPAPAPAPGIDPGPGIQTHATPAPEAPAAEEWNI